MAPRTHPGMRPVSMETRCFHEKLLYHRQNISVPLSMSTILRKRIYKLFEPPPKSNCWDDLVGKIGLRKTRQNSNSKCRDSESSRDIDRQNPQLRQEISKGARSFGDLTHPLVTVLTKLPVIGGGCWPCVSY